MIAESWYHSQANLNTNNKVPVITKNEPGSPPTGRESGALNDNGDEGVGGSGEEVNIAEVTHKSRVEVTRKNKVICTVAYFFLIMGLTGYMVLMALYHTWYPEVWLFYQGIFIVTYLLFASDILTSGIGIWTCLAKTGPKPMLIVCAWLLLSSLIDLCVSISLTHDDKQLAKERSKRCRKGMENTV